MADKAVAHELARSTEILQRPGAVLACAAAAMCREVPRAFGFAHIYEEGARAINWMTMIADGGAVDVDRMREAYARSTPGFDRNLVQPSQRNRWVEPLRLVLTQRTLQSPVVREADRLGIWEFGRILVCWDAVPVACIGAALPKRSRSFDGRERAGLARVGRTLIAPLRAAALLSFAAARPAVAGQQRERVTAREAVLLAHLREGRRNREIADAMGVKPSTVKTMLERLYRKFGARNRSHLVTRVARVEPL